MKFASSALLIVPLLAFISATAAVPSPVAVPDDAGVKSKITQLLEVRDTTELLEARAPVTGTVNSNNVRYRRCPNTSPACEPVGQYNSGQRITIICRAIGETVNGWSWWDRMDNGFWISDYYVDWTGGVPDVCP